jgi:hypothetical protein
MHFSSVGPENGCNRLVEMNEYRVNRICLQILTYFLSMREPGFQQLQALLMRQPELMKAISS